MSDINYDPELPFAVIIRQAFQDDAILGRFPAWWYADQFAKAGTALREIVDTTPKPKIPEDAQHITWGTGDVAYSRYHDGRWYGWTDSGGLSDEELLTIIGNNEVTVRVRKDET